MHRILPAIATLGAFMVAGCQETVSPELEAIRDKGELVVITRNAPTTYYINRHDEPAGFEHDLASNFADHLGVDVRFKTRHSIADVQQALRNGAGHLAAAGLTRLESREKAFRFGPAYHRIQQKLVCNRNGRKPRNLEQLTDVSLLVIGDSSYEERLQELKEDQLPELEWQSDSSLTTEIILRKVQEKEVDCTLADSNIVAINRRYYPELDVVRPMSETQELAWMMPQEAEGLEQAVEEWFADVEDGALLSRLMTRYYAHVEIFDYVDISRYVRRIDERLPQYRQLFEKAGEKHDVAWDLLTAMGYQESHWNPKARSPTGVRGIMMLTQATAKRVGVDNRLDPQQSIMGGAQYLAELRERLPEGLEEPDRTWVAMAAYNVGMGHIYDARKLAERLGRDKNSWSDLRKVLPKLAQPEYYKDLRYGYARGGEPVHYLRRIRNYREIMERHLEGDPVERNRFW